MFKRFDFSVFHVFFWITTAIVYWGLIFFAWLETRFRVFLGAEVVRELMNQKKIGLIVQDLTPLAQRAWTAIAERGDLPRPFMIIPVVMAISMFVIPFVVRRDYRAPIRGVFSLPLMTLLCYLLASFLNTIISAGFGIGIHAYLRTSPGPEFFMFLVHPLYLLFPPALDCTAGVISQLVYIAFIASVLTLRAHKRFVPRWDDGLHSHEAVQVATRYTEDELQQLTTCSMETDRLCRLIDGKIAHPSLTHAIRIAVMDYINTPFLIAGDISMGMEAYHIVLREAAKGVRQIVEENAERPGAKDAFLYITGEMERMGYCTKEGREALVGWLEVQATNGAEQAGDATAPPTDSPVA